MYIGSGTLGYRDGRLGFGDGRMALGLGDGRFTTASTGQGPKRDLTRACGGEGKVRDSRREAVVRLRSCEFLG